MINHFRGLRLRAVGQDDLVDEIDGSVNSIHGKNGKDWAKYFLLHGWTVFGDIRKDGWRNVVFLFIQIPPHGYSALLEKGLGRGL